MNSQAWDDSMVLREHNPVVIFVGIGNFTAFFQGFVYMYIRDGTMKIQMALELEQLWPMFEKIC